MQCTVTYIWLLWNILNWYFKSPFRISVAHIQNWFESSSQQMCKSIWSVQKGFITHAIKYWQAVWPELVQKQVSTTTKCVPSARNVGAILAWQWGHHNSSSCDILSCNFLKLCLTLFGTSVAPQIFATWLHYNILIFFHNLKTADSMFDANNISIESFRFYCNEK